MEELFECSGHSSSLVFEKSTCGNEVPLNNVSTHLESPCVPLEIHIQVENSRYIPLDGIALKSLDILGKFVNLSRP